MNLLVKSIGQLLMITVALFFFSCEDETTLGYKNPNQKFQVNYIDIPLASSVVLLDSVITDRTGVGLIGKYNDPLLGAVSAQPFLQFYPGFSARLSNTPVYDSVTIEFRVNFYTYGFSGNSTQRFTVHELADSVDRFKFYYGNNSISFNPNSIGELRFNVDYETYKKQYDTSPSDRDTLIVSTRLSDTFGQNLFNLSTNSDFTTAAELKNFFFNMKGLTLVSQESNGVLGLDIASGFSRLKLHYHNAQDTLVASFIINTPSFSNITADRSGTELGGYPTYQQIDPASGMRYVQSGSLALTQLDLSNFYAFADTLDNILINTAELHIANVEAPAGTPVHSNFILSAMNSGNKIANGKVAADRELVAPYYITNFNVFSDSPGAADDYAQFSYDSKEKLYRGNLTLFAQSLFRNKSKENGPNESRLRYLAVFPNSPNAARTINRTVFHKDNIKLRIYYTRPTQLN
jgi:hypothetical protein